MPAAQGPKTEPASVEAIRAALRNKAETTVRILNYRKSGKPFWNMLTIAPMADVDGTPRFLIGVQARCDPMLHLLLHPSTLAAVLHVFLRSEYTSMQQPLYC